MSSSSVIPTQPVTAPSRFLDLSNLPSSASLVYSCYLYNGKDITDALLERCAQFFSRNYGVWGLNPATAKAPKAGSRVKMSRHRLREEIMSVPESTVLAACYWKNPDSNALELVGHAFATVWDYNGGRVGWVTQLVVSLTMRRMYIATSLLQTLKRSALFHGVTAIGIASSHPAALHALCKYNNLSIRSVDLNFCQRNAKAILEASPVPYIKGKELHGSLFEKNCTTGAVSCAFTNFYVDHTEPREALAAYKSTGDWVLGEPLQGHEFLVILPAKAVAN